MMLCYTKVNFKTNNLFFNGYFQNGGNTTTTFEQVHDILRIILTYLYVRINLKIAYNGNKELILYLYQIKTQTAESLVLKAIKTYACLDSYRHLNLSCLKQNVTIQDINKLFKTVLLMPFKKYDLFRHTLLVLNHENFNEP